MLIEYQPRVMTQVSLPHESAISQLPALTGSGS